MPPSKYDLFYKLDQAIESQTLPEFFVEEFKVEDLRKLCKAAKLSPNGDKDVLAKRLQKYIMAPKSRVAQKIQSIILLILSILPTVIGAKNTTVENGKKTNEITVSILQWIGMSNFVRELFKLIVIMNNPKQRKRASRIRTIKQEIANSRKTRRQKKNTLLGFFGK